MEEILSCAANETPLRRVVAGLPEGLSTRTPKKFIDFVPYFLSNPTNYLQRLPIFNTENQLQDLRKKTEDAKILGNKFQ